jgi:hypothetical protein
MGEAASHRAKTPLWMWAALAALTALMIATMALHAIHFGVDAAHLPIAPEPHWGWQLRFRVYEPLGYLSLAAPILAVAALVWRTWRTAALALLAFCALFQVAALGLEYRWRQQECAGEFDRKFPGSIDLWDKSPKPRSC